MSAPGLVLDRADQIEEMKRRTHDSLIARLGPRRRSGISWYVFRGEQAEGFFADWAALPPEDLEAGVTTVEFAAAVDQYRAFLREHRDRSVLIIATCKAVR